MWNMRRIWNMWRRERERVMHVTISGGALTAFEKLANDMDADPDVVFNCALCTLKWIVHHAQKGGELMGQNGNEEFVLAISYENKRGQIVSMPPQDVDSSDWKPSKTLRLSDDDKRFLKDIGIEPD